MGRVSVWLLMGLSQGLVGCGSDQTPKGSGGAAGDTAGGSGASMSGASHGGSNSAAGGVSAGGASTAGGAEDGEAGEDQGPAAGGCNISQPFGAPLPLTELNSAEHEAGPRLSSDELRILYLCADGTTVQLCTAERTSRTGTFGTPEVVVPSDAGVGWLSDDALLLFYEDDKSRELFATTREQTGVAFGQGGTVLFEYGDPYVVGGEDGSLYVSQAPTGGLAVAKLSGWVPRAPEPISGAGALDRRVRPVLTPDELTMYFGLPAKAGASALDVWVQERKSKAEVFGDPVNVAEINTDEAEFPGWISDDGCRLYFDSGTTPRDLFVAERAH